MCFSVSICVLENLYMHFLNFVCSFTCNREGPSRLQVQRAEVQGRSKLVDELFFAEGYGKDKHWGLLRLLSLIPLEVTTMTVAAAGPIWISAGNRHLRWPLAT